MTDEQINIKAVVDKLIGPIEPVGDSNIDRERLGNLKEYILVVDDVITELFQISNRYKNNHQHSMKLASATAYDFLKDLGKDIEAELKEHDDD